ncbi:ATP-dependent DNA ligase [Candidatus Micrarchaeota archaeon]|nr:ATP-dependent DNA ligase [Candidatus Micrarchaeota archaeon]
MEFSRLASVFSTLESTSSRLTLAGDLAGLFSEAGRSEARILAYLLQGLLSPEFTGVELGLGDKLAEQAIAAVAGCRVAEVEVHYRKTGDLGTAAEMLLGQKRQTTLSETSRGLGVRKVYGNLEKIASLSGGGSQEQKIKLLSELLSAGSPLEAKVLVRFVTGNLRLGIGEPTILDGLALVHLRNSTAHAEEVSIGSGSKILLPGASLSPVVWREASELPPAFSRLRPADRVNSLILRLSPRQGQAPQLLSLKEKNAPVSFASAGGAELFSATLTRVAQGPDSEGVFLQLDILDAKRRVRESLDRAYNLRSDLGMVSELFMNEGLEAVRRISPEVFYPIRPALAERLENAGAIFEKLGECAVEGKYDGFRLAIHKKGGEVRIYSRRQEPMGHMFPEIVQAVRKHVKARECIMEGEALAYDAATGAFLPFQATITRKRKHGIEEKAGELPLKLFAFEILYLDGKDLTGLPFRERRKLLEKTVSPGGPIECASLINARAAGDLERFFGQCVSEGLEGIIAKDWNAPYTAGARKFAWIKFKRSYSGKLADTIDAVVIGYYLGKGKRTKFGFGGMLTAIYSRKENKFKSIAKVGTGFTEAEMTELQKRLEKISLASKPQNVETLLEPDVWVRPQLVVTLNADEITRSPIHACAIGSWEIGGHAGEGLALRFPRLTAIREDKAPQDATTEEEIIGMFQMQKSYRKSEAGA